VERIRVVGMFNVPGERLAEFKKAAAQLVEVANRGAGTLQYDWYSNKDETASVCLEEPEDSAAFLTHTANLGKPHRRLVASSGGGTYEVFGNPTAELREAITGPRISVFPRHFRGK
jgi:quinol monooxygenase YgiN